MAYIELHFNYISRLRHPRNEGVAQGSFAVGSNLCCYSVA
jgi:hypothetical protein